MKRREFLRASASITGAIVPAIAWAETKPCRPPEVRILGGTASANACAVSADALADWQARSTAPGVIWAHRFEGPEANGLYWNYTSANFAQNKRFGYINATTHTQSGPSGVRAEAGIIGDGCLEQYIPAGSVINGGWGRPLAPVSAIPAASEPGGVGNIPAFEADINNAGIERLNFGAFYQPDPGDKWYNGGGGLFSHPNDAGLNRYIETFKHNEIVYSGADGFYIQFRVKFKTLANGDNRLDYTNPNTTGKLFILSNISHSIPESEVVNQIRPAQGLDHQLYVSPRGVTLGDGVWPITTTQPNSDLGNKLWRWQKDKWITVLLHVIPPQKQPASLDGLYAQAGYATWYPAAPNKNGVVQVWAAEEGATSYTKIHDYRAYAFFYDAVYSGNYKFAVDPNWTGGDPKVMQGPGYSWMAFTPFMNEVGTSAGTYAKDFWILFDQIICSTQFIPCPIV